MDNSTWMRAIFTRHFCECSDIHVYAIVAHKMHHQERSYHAHMHNVWHSPRQSVLLSCSYAKHTHTHRRIRDVLSRAGITFLHRISFHHFPVRAQSLNAWTMSECVIWMALPLVIALKIIYTYGNCFNSIFKIHACIIICEFIMNIFFVFISKCFRFNAKYEVFYIWCTFHCKNTLFRESTVNSMFSKGSNHIAKKECTWTQRKWMI